MVTIDTVPSGTHRIHRTTEVRATIRGMTFPALTVNGGALIHVERWRLQVPIHLGSSDVHDGALTILAGIAYIGGTLLRNPLNNARRLAAAQP